MDIGPSETETFWRSCTDLILPNFCGNAKHKAATAHKPFLAIASSYWRVAGLNARSAGNRLEHG